MYKGIEKIDANQKCKKMKRKIQVGSVGLQLFSKQSIYPKPSAPLCQTLEHKCPTKIRFWRSSSETVYNQYRLEGLGWFLSKWRSETMDNQ